MDKRTYRQYGTCRNGSDHLHQEDSLLNHCLDQGEILYLPGRYQTNQQVQPACNLQ